VQSLIVTRWGCQNRFLRGGQLSSPRPTEFDSGEYVGNVANAGSSRSSRTVTTDARTDGAPSGTTTELSSYRCIIRNRYVLSNPQYHTPRIERKVITVPGGRARERHPAALPQKFDRWPRPARKQRGTRLDVDGSLGLIDRAYCGVHFRRFFGSLTKRFSLVNIRFSGCQARFLIAQSCFVEQPPTTRNRVFDDITLVEILLDEYRRLRRRSETDRLG